MYNNCIYNSWLKSFKEPFGAIKTEEKVIYRIALNENIKVKKVEFLTCLFGEWNNPKIYPMKYIKTIDKNNIFAIETSFKVVRVHGYCFRYQMLDGSYKYLKKDPQTNNAYISDGDGEHWLQTVYDKNTNYKKFDKPDVMYQIFPDRFNKSDVKHKNIPSDRIIVDDWYKNPSYLPEDSSGMIKNNEYYGGDIKGIIEKLEYLKDLGIDIIYLNPICEAHSSHRYNTANYLVVDPMLGTWDDVKELCDKAHSLEMIVILDGVFSHSGSDSVYFNKEKRYSRLGAANSKSSLYRSWYQIHKDEKGNDVFDYWWGFKSLVKFDKDSPDFQKFIAGKHGVLARWLSYGIDGVRLDVADDLPDHFITLMRKNIKSIKADSYYIGEVWKNAVIGFPDEKQKRMYAIDQGLDGVMNYQFRDIIIDYMKYGNQNIKNRVYEILELYPKDFLLASMNLLSSHDRERILTKLVGPERSFSDNERANFEDRKWYAAHDKLNEDDYKRAKQMLKVASIMQFFWPGIPSIYYGDEAGLLGYLDPFCRKPFPWGKEDKDIFYYYKNLIKIRHSHKFLASSANMKIEYIDSNIMIFTRYDKNNLMIFAINRTNTIQYIDNIINNIIMNLSLNIKNFKIEMSLEKSDLKKLNPYGAIIINKK